MIRWTLIFVVLSVAGESAYADPGVELRREVLRSLEKGNLACTVIGSNDDVVSFAFKSMIFEDSPRPSRHGISFVLVVGKDGPGFGCKAETMAGGIASLSRLTISDGTATYQSNAIAEHRDFPPSSSNTLYSVARSEFAIKRDAIDILIRSRDATLSIHGATEIDLPHSFTVSNELKNQLAELARIDRLLRDSKLTNDNITGICDCSDLRGQIYWDEEARRETERKVIASNLAELKKSVALSIQPAKTMPGVNPNEWRQLVVRNPTHVNAYLIVVAISDSRNPAKPIILKIPELPANEQRLRTFRIPESWTPIIKLESISLDPPPPTTKKAATADKKRAPGK